MKDSDLIRRSDVRAAFCKVCAYNEVCDKKKRGDDWCCPAMDNIDSIPAVDAVEVRHGYNTLWEYSSLFECSLCGWGCSDTIPGDTGTYNYCPACGARMDGRREDGDA